MSLSRPDVCVHVHVRVHVYVQVCVYLCVHVRVHLHAHIQVPSKNVPKHEFTGMSHTSFQKGPLCQKRAKVE
jgi:hypothetical protein